MKRCLSLCLTLLSLLAIPMPSPAAESSPGQKVRPQVADYLSQRIAEFDQIPADRQADLKKLAAFVRSRVSAGEPATLVFICTHNSRRSHLAQIWAAEAANHYGVPKVECFSGGTEATAFNSRAVAALRRTGLEVDKTGDDKNPKYQVQIAAGVQLVCFSKKYSDDSNPSKDFCAVMTCSTADKACPSVAGAAARVAVPYEDPKVSDDTAEEAATYDARCAQICREMLFVFSQVGK